jgi:hypothetical protein
MFELINEMILEFGGTIEQVTSHTWTVEFASQEDADDIIEFVNGVVSPYHAERHCFIDYLIVIKFEV